MAKIDWTKWILLAWALATAMTWCGGNGWKWSIDNHTPDIEKVPSSFAMPDETKKIINDIICIDSDGDKIEMTTVSSNPNLKVSYDENSSKLSLDAEAWDLAVWANEDVNVILTCSDGDLNTTANIKVTVQDETNDPLYSINHINFTDSITEWDDFNISIKWHDNDWAPKFISYEIKDSNNTSVTDIEYMNCQLDNWSSTDSTCTANISGLPVGNYKIFYTIEPTKVWRNEQKDIKWNESFEVVSSAPSWNQLPSDVTINWVADWTWEVFETLDLNFKNVDLDDVVYNIENLYFSDWGPYTFTLRPWESAHWIRITLDWNVEIYDYDDGWNYFWNTNTWDIKISHSTLWDQTVDLDFSWITN